MMRGHVPIRQCIGCRRRRPKAELIRLALDGERVVPRTGKSGLPGRGCYVCPLEDCVSAALKKGRLSRALRRNTVALPSSDELLIGAGTEGVTG